MGLRPYQEQAADAVEREWGAGRSRTLLTMATGCHRPDQLILMASGDVRRANEVKIGDMLMGPDGSPRTVLSLHSGTSHMVEVTPVKGEPFVVTHDHMLPLVRTNRTSDQSDYRSIRDGMVDTMTADEWISSSKTSKHLHKLYRSRAIGSFDGNDGSSVTIDPYFVGILLGDGGLKYGINVTTAEPEVEDVIRKQAAIYGMTLRPVPAGKANTWHMLSGECGCGGGRLHRLLSELGMAGKGSGEKFVPSHYKTLPIEQRLEVVAGLIDTDGCLTCGGYDFISKSRRLSDDLAFMCRSAGLAAYVSESHKKAQGGFSGTYYRVSISGACETIPCRVARRSAPVRKQKKDVLRTGISSIRHIGDGEYFGFTVDRDNLYLMGDFTVTHNCGKTIVMAELARRVAAHGGRTLLLAHRGELLSQAADKIGRFTGLSCAVEKAEQTCVGTWSSVTVGSVQTLMRDSRLDALAPDRFDCVMVDEAHHALADGYTKVLDHFAGAKILGVTATPDRGDQRDLGEVFDSLAYEYGLAQAVKDGWLCAIEAQMLPVTLDVSGVSIQAGDYAAGQLGDALDPYLDAIADAMAAEGLRDRHTVVFLPLVRTAKAFRDRLCERGFRAAEVDGQSEDRAEVLADFDAGRYDVLCNSMLLTEGWDCPSVDCIVMLRPTKSRSLYAQCIGRGTRLSPETGKEKLLLLDFLWLTGRHELCRPASLVARTPEVSARMTEMSQEAGGPVDLMGTEDQAETDVQVAREESLARELESKRRRKAKLVDPLLFEMSICDHDLQGYVPTFAWQQARPSEAQTHALETWGVDPTDMDAGKASLMLDRLAKRKDAGMATPKQVRMLERKGFVHPGEWTFKQAGAMMTRLSQNGWKVPVDVTPATYAPKPNDKKEVAI